MTYQEALELIDADRRGRTTVLFGFPGGRARYLWLDREPIDSEKDAVKVTLMGSHIATIYPDDSIQLWTRGYDTATTREAFRYLLRPTGSAWGIDSKLYIVNRHNGRREFEEGMVV